MNIVLSLYIPRGDARLNPNTELDSQDEVGYASPILNGFEHRGHSRHSSDENKYISMNNLPEYVNLEVVECYTLQNKDCNQPPVTSSEAEEQAPHKTVVHV